MLYKFKVKEIEKMRKAIIILVLSLSFVFIGCNNKEEPYSDQEEKYNIDFINSCNLININVENISYYQKSQNWVGGERYSFSYKHKDYPIETFYVYYNLDGKVYSINYGDIKLYEINKTPWDVENYLVSYDMEIDLSIWAEDTINKILLFPLTASYSTYDWLYKRYRDIYTVSNYVEYENAFGVEIKSSFYLEFRVSTKGKLLYGVFNNTVIYGENSQIKEEYREIINPETEDDQSDYIYIKYDNIGKYGKSETYDGYTSIYYYIPAGTYNVEGLLKGSKIYICNNEMIKVDGYWEDDVVKTVSFKSQNEIHEITIGKNQRLLITMYAEFKLYESDIKETINQYTITFNSNEGSSVTEITQDYNTIVLEPEEPVKEGYSFVGWYSDSTLTTPYSFTTMPSKNIILYARWEIN